MVDKDMLEAMRQLMQEELTHIHDRLDTMQKDIDTIKSDVDILKRGFSHYPRSNTMLAWAEKAQVQVQIPLFNKAE